MLALQEGVTDLYLDFVRERHAIWERRQAGDPQPWTEDPVLLANKFTNVYRILDHGSQFVVRELLYSDEPSMPDALMRCFLYRYMNRPEPWVWFKEQTGHYPNRRDLDIFQLRTLWEHYKAGGLPMFGTAYKMFVGNENAGTDRLTWILNLTSRFFGYGDEAVETINHFTACGTMEERLAVLQTIPRCAGFMSMQIVTDMGLSPYLKADENEFVLPGPGAKRGAAELAGKVPAVDVIRWAQQELQDVRLQGRSPSLMDIQNTLCEFSKYMRYYRGGPSRTKLYRPAHPGPQEEPFLPPHWKEQP